MIRYTLSCADHHEFESWFQSAEAFDSLLADRRLSCAICGSDRVRKMLMAPALGSTGKERDKAPPGTLTTPTTPAEAALAALRREIETKSDYVGLDFAAEARAIHEGTAPERTIHGEARLDEARKLLEDGVPVAPLPFRSQRRSN